MQQFMVRLWQRIRSSTMTSVVLCALFVGAVSVTPYVLHTFSPEYRGFTVIRDKDFANYDARLERALSGYPNEASNGITQVGSGFQGLQPAAMENVISILFSWTGLPAPPLSVIVTGIFGALLFVLFYKLFRELEFSHRWALGMNGALFVIMFHVFTRVMHPGWSFTIAIGAFLATFSFLRKPDLLKLFLTAILLAFLPYLYFWHWSFVWGACGGVVLLALISRQPQLRIQWKWLIALGFLTLAFCIPFIVDTVQLMHNPLYPEIAVRASFLYQRYPESWPRSILLTIQVLCFLSLFPRYRTQRSYILCGGILLGLFLAMHQNVFHNKVLMLTSHMEPHMIIASFVAGAWVLYAKAPIIRRMVIAGIAAVLFVAGAYDYSPGHNFFIPRAFDFRDQHLKEPITLLNDGPQNVVLTDSETARVVTAWTPSGVIYTRHVRFLLIPDTEIAERYCMSQFFNPDMPDPFRGVYNEYNHVLDSPEMKEHERQMVEEACTRIRKNPRQYLEKYHVTHVLWNKTYAPTWVIEGREQELGLLKQASGSGWSLHSVIQM